MSRTTTYVGAVFAASIAAASLLPWDVVVGLDSSSWNGLGIMLGLGIVSERLTIGTSIGKSGSTHSVAFLPLLAAVLLFGPAAGVVFIAITHAVGDFLLRRKEPIRGIFNVGQHVFAASLGGLAFHALAPAAAPIRLGDGISGGFPWLGLLAFGALYLALNHVLVARVISIASGVDFTTVWKQAVGKAGGNFLYDLLVSPVAVAIALMGAQFGEAGLIMAGLPLLAIRNAYHVNFRLQQANRDLLSALVKAIETRDPYTSGHSVRVAKLAVLVARESGFSQKQEELLEQSALLHDVGKIDAVYTEILRKPEALTDEERDVIQSHVAKGVELLTELSSVPKEVILDVRHHHERWNGNGYPDGLSGEAIPIGARIIGVCDAVDAMLSDRPYRKALPLSTVRDELTRYSGVQFDPSVVRVLTSSDVLEQHRRALDSEAASQHDIPQWDSAPKSRQEPGPSGRSGASIAAPVRALKEALPELAAVDRSERRP